MLKETSKVVTAQLEQVGLNPYFNGTCSKREYKDSTTYDLDEVLILILMEHAQREHFL